MNKMLVKLKNLSLLLVICIFFFSFWLYYNFGKVTFEQLNSVLSLQFSSINSDIQFAFIKWVIILPLSIALVLWGGEFSQRKWPYGLLISRVLLVIGAVLFSLKVNTDFFSIQKIVQNEQKNNIFSAYKIPVLALTQNPKPTKNIIWIFVESLEKGYKNELMLSHLEKSTSFMSPMEVSPLINKYTIGAVMSAKCGAPLYLKSFINQNALSHSAFSNAICYDDVLRVNGYDSYFLVGHDATFSGLEDYYKQHANAHILDKKYFEHIKLAKNSSFDSYPDESLFANALEILKSKDLKKPYSLNILTLDNHAPTGFPSDYCKKKYGEYIADVINCNSDLLAQFVDDLKASGILDDTVLVIMGDHPFMGEFAELPDERKIFAKIYTPIKSKSIVNTRPSPFDFFPSVLSAAGFELPVTQYGFGYSFYDVETYPMIDWKSKLSQLSYQTPTESYFKLHYK